MKNYSVVVDMIWSKRYFVKAKSTREAKKKAWAKFVKKPKKVDFNLTATKEEP